MSEWQPIETAPKDGTRIIVWSIDLEKAEFVRWSDRHSYFGLDGQEHFSCGRMSHWIPEPAPPSNA